MKIEQIKEQFKDEWVLVEVLKEDRVGRPQDVQLLAHSKSRTDTYEAMKKVKSKYTFHFYTGEATNKEYAVAFHVHT